MRSSAEPRSAVPRLAIVVPVLNEGARINALATALAPARAAGDEVVLVDGGSADDTVARAHAHGLRVIVAERGRAAQMNAGAAATRAPVLWFVHADTVPDADTRTAVLAATARGPAWGRCAVRFDERSPVFSLIAWAMNLRSRLTAIATGDQALFVTRDLFDAVGGYPPLALMEDIEISASLRGHCRPHCLRAAVTTSARRWRSRGVLRTILLMWSLRLAWFCGVPASRLARWYGYR